MKPHYYIILCVITAIFVACSNGSKCEYESLDGYNGKVKKIIIYNYENDIQVNRIISKYGGKIPESVREYNKCGLLEREISVSLPDEDDDCNICTIKVDSTRYNKQNQEVYNVIYTIFVSPDEVLLYNEPERLINSSSTYTIKYERNTEYLAKDNMIFETKVECVHQDINKLYELPTTMEKNVGRYLRDLGINPEMSFMDTLMFEREYHNGQLIRKIEYHDDYCMETLNSYDDGLLVGSTEISKGDTTHTKYSYENGILREVNNGFWTHRYDDKGRLIYLHSKNGSESVRMYKDTSSISTLSDKYLGNSVDLDIVNKDSLVVLNVSIDLDERSTYVDDAIILLERFRDREISQKELENEVEKIALKIDESTHSAIETTVYSNYDICNNPLKIVKRRICISTSSDSYFRHYLGLDRVVNRFEHKDIVEKQIEYFE